MLLKDVDSDEKAILDDENEDRPGERISRVWQYDGRTLKYCS